jgi:hypothetical protein
MHTSRYESYRAFSGLAHSEDTPFVNSTLRRGYYPRMFFMKFEMQLVNLDCGFV